MFIENAFAMCRNRTIVGLKQEIAQGQVIERVSRNRTIVGLKQGITGYTQRVGVRRNRTIVGLKLPKPTLLRPPMKGRNRTIVGLKLAMSEIKCRCGDKESQSHHSGIETGELRFLPCLSAGKSQSHHSGIETYHYEARRMPDRKVAIAP